MVVGDHIRAQEIKPETPNLMSNKKELTNAHVEASLLSQRDEIAEEKCRNKLNIRYPLRLEENTAIQHLLNEPAKLFTVKFLIL